MHVSKVIPLRFGDLVLQFPQTGYQINSVSLWMYLEVFLTLRPCPAGLRGNGSQSKMLIDIYMYKVKLNYSNTSITVYKSHLSGGCPDRSDSPLYNITDADGAIVNSCCFCKIRSISCSKFSMEIKEFIYEVPF